MVSLDRFRDVASPLDIVIEFSHFSAKQITLDRDQASSNQLYVGGALRIGPSASGRSTSVQNCLFELCRIFKLRLSGNYRIYCGYVVRETTQLAYIRLVPFRRCIRNNHFDRFRSEFFDALLNLLICQNESLQGAPQYSNFNKFRTLELRGNALFAKTHCLSPHSAKGICTHLGKIGVLLP